MDLNNLHRIYLIGIGGIGMSALARYFNAKGVSVHGYDKTPTKLTQQLIDEGMDIHFEENIKLIPDDIDLVIYTPAIPASNKEYRYFIENKFNIKKRSEILGLLTNDIYTFAIAGTHGKTSITSLIAHILHENNVNVTAFFGGISKNYNSNLILSEKTDVFVVEADEYDRSFLTLHPDIAVISAIDADHLDIYNTKNKLEESYYLFAEQIKDNGKLIIKKNIPLPVKFYNKRTQYSLNKGGNAYASNIRKNNGETIFDIVCNKNSIKDIKFNIPGNHNVENAVAAVTAVMSSGIKTEEEKIKNALESYKGLERRFDYRVNDKNIVFIDDYAHHPKELEACISAVKELYTGKKVTGIFQPHLFSRTRDFADEFAKSLEMLDEIILLEIYPARELPIEGVTSKMLLDKIKKENKLLCSKGELLKKLDERKLEVVLTLGAGDIDQLVEPIEKMLIKKYLTT